MNIIYNAWSFLILKVNALQADLNKLQGQQVSLQLEHKELKKKQRRSERYYTNKQTKDGGSQNDSLQGDDVEMVGDVSLQDDLTQEDDRSEEGWFTEISEIFNFKVPYINYACRILWMPSLQDVDYCTKSFLHRILTTSFRPNVKLFVRRTRL